MSDNAEGLTWETIQSVLDAISLGGLWLSPSWHVRRVSSRSHGDGYLVQLRYLEQDIDKPCSDPVIQRTREWYLSPEQSVTDVIRTAHKLCMTSLEHRLGEHFVVDLDVLNAYLSHPLQASEARPYSPHFRIGDLLAVDVYSTKDGQLQAPEKVG